jgi:3-phenylpropionate/trans-cinnamate dioxygenase ferredoxin reductase component
LTASSCGVVIVGGGIAAVSTAAALRAGGFEGELTLIDACDFPHDRPPLSKDFLAGARNLEDIALQPESWYDKQSVRLIARSTVTALRPAEGGVELTSGLLLRADRVVLAMGGRAARPRIPGAYGPSVHVLRSALDAVRLRDTLKRGARVLVVGAGLIGLGCEVTLADPASPPLAAVLGGEVASWLHGIHAERGIKLVTSGVPTLEGADADAVVLGTGMVPLTALAGMDGIEADQGIVVDDGQVTSNPAVLAVGDCCRRRDEAPAGHWEAAQADGQRAAASILGMPAPARTAPWFWTDRHGMHVEVTGHLGPETRTIVRGQFGEPPFAVFGVRDGKVASAVAVNDPTAARAARRLIDRGIAADPERLADPAADLRSLLRR